MKTRSNSFQGDKKDNIADSSLNLSPKKTPDLEKTICETADTSSSKDENICVVPDTVANYAEAAEKTPSMQVDMRSTDYHCLKFLFFCSL